MTTTTEQARRTEKCLRENFNGSYLSESVPDTIAALISENEELVRDAERYRWLRKRVGVSFDTSYPSVWLPTGRSKIDVGDEMKTDAAIDAAIAAQGVK